MQRAFHLNCARAAVPRPLAVELVAEQTAFTQQRAAPGAAAGRALRRRRHQLHPKNNFPRLRTHAGAAGAL